jgi:hypothetical protein
MDMPLLMALVVAVVVADLGRSLKMFLATFLVVVVAVAAEEVLVVAQIFNTIFTWTLSRRLRVGAQRSRSQHWLSVLSA